MGVGGQHHARPLCLREWPDTHRTGDWVGLTTSLDECGKSRPLTGFDPRIVQTIAIQYTDCTILAHVAGYV